MRALDWGKDVEREIEELTTFVTSAKRCTNRATSTNVINIVE